MCQPLLRRTHLLEPQGNASEFSSSELNPLLNPLLNGNLQRWAQVYFGNPPEKRDAAVNQLLRELRGELHANEGPDIQLDSIVVCSKCGRKSKPGQKFCGLCGVRLPLEGTSRPPQADTSKVETRQPDSEIAEPFAPVPEVSDEGHEMDWLRQRLTSVPTGSKPPQARWKYAALGIAVLLGAFGVLKWWLQTPSSAAVAVPEGSSSQPALRNDAVQPILTTEPARPAGIVENAAKIVSRDNSDLTSAMASDLTQNAPAAQPGGSYELKTAQEYLDGRNRARDPEQAARWLWKAVGKHNTRASVLLADLYLHGQGVNRSCDQARLLLTAAAQKGSTDATAKLNNLEGEGCP